MTYGGAWQIGDLVLVTYRKLDNQCIYQYLSLFATIRHYSLLFVTIRHYSSLFATIRHYSLLFVTIRHLSSLFATIHHYSRLFVTVRDYSRLFAVFGDYSGFITSRRRWLRKATLLYWFPDRTRCKLENFFEIQDLTMRCPIRLCRDWNDGVAIFTKLSLVFLCRN